MEITAQHKHEYLEGVIYAWQGQVPESMAGGSRAHHRITFNIANALNAALKGTECAQYMADMRLRVAASATRKEDAFFYPDVFVQCGPLPPTEVTAIENPKLVIEVLSPSTEDFDRNEKFEVYASIASVAEIAFVNSIHPHAFEVYRRDAAQAFVRVDTDPNRLQLESVGVEITREALLEGV